MLVRNGNKDTVSSKRDRSKILAGEGTIFWQPGSAGTWLKSGSSWEEQRVQGSKQTRFKAGSFKELSRELSSILGGSASRVIARHSRGVRFRSRP